MFVQITRIYLNEREHAGSKNERKKQVSNYGSQTLRWQLQQCPHAILLFIGLGAFFNAFNLVVREDEELAQTLMLSS